MAYESEANRSLKLDKLIEEIKVLKAVNSSLHTKIISLETKAYMKDLEAKALSTKLENAKSRIEYFENEKSITVKKFTTKIKQLEREKKRNDLFNQKIAGTSRSAKESLMIQEMDSLRSVNSTLLGIINLLGKEIGFDSEIITKIAEIADGVDDNILKLFVASIKGCDQSLLVRKRDIILNPIEANKNDEN